MYATTSCPKLAQYVIVYEFKYGIYTETKCDGLFF